MWRDEVTGFVFGRKFHEFIRNDDAYGKRFDAYFFVYIDFLAVQELFDIGMEDIEVYSACPRALAKLIGIGKGIFQDFHDWQYPACAAFDAFNGFASGPDFGYVERYTTANGGKLHCRIHCITDAV